MPNFAAIQQAAPVVITPATPPAPAAAQGQQRPSRKQEGSKRTTRKLSGFYLTPETAARLKRYVLGRQEAGDRVDASDVVEEALRALLN